ncbi:MAG TPA: nickel pincer cofactor biosynthesis protein LarC [Candidatus Dormibacteraeota bacterium]
MTIAYFDCFAGISGDMTLGALVDAGADRNLLDATIEALRLGDEVSVDVRHEQRGHAGGTRVIVQTLDRRQRTVPDLRAAVSAAEVPDEVKRPALSALERLGRAEARLHDLPESKVHLHELGGADTLVDLVGAFWLLHNLSVAQVYASALPAPSGRAGHMPLPAPASMRVLEGTGATFQATDETRELVTPTGAAILAVAARFSRPAMSLQSIGYGIGARDVPGNALAVWIGAEVATATGVTMIETNIDDMAPNLIAALCEDLMALGALDVSVLPAVMKKGRPGHVLAVMATPDTAALLADHVLRHSTTLGVRLTPADRVIAQRRMIEVKTEFGVARAKVKEIGGEAVDVAPEYEDCRRLARESGRDLSAVMRAVATAARKELGLD